jgi:hypothetical protein
MNGYPSPSPLDLTASFVQEPTQDLTMNYQWQPFGIPMVKYELDNMPQSFTEY